MAQKKPPMSIKELEEKTKGSELVEKEEEKPGSISYVGTVPKKEESGDVRYTDDGRRLVKRKKKQGKRSSYIFLGYSVEPVPILLSVIVSLVVTIIMISLLAGSKDDVNYVYSLQMENQETLSGLSTNIDSFQTSVLENSSRLDNVINAQGQYAKKEDIKGLTAPDLSNYVTLDVFNSLKDIVGTLSSDISLDSTSTTVNPERVVSSVSQPSTFRFPVGYASQKVVVSVKIENGLSKSVSGIEVQAVVHTNGGKLDFRTTLCSVEGGWPLVWTVSHASSGVVILKGSNPSLWDGLTLSPGGSKIIPIEVTLGVVKPPSTDVYVYAEAETVNYN